MKTFYYFIFDMSFKVRVSFVVIVALELKKIVVNIQQQCLQEHYKITANGR